MLSRLKPSLNLLRGVSAYMKQFHRSFVQLREQVHFTQQVKTTFLGEGWKAVVSNLVFVLTQSWNSTSQFNTISAGSLKTHGLYTNCTTSPIKQP